VLGVRGGERDFALSHFNSYISNSYIDTKSDFVADFVARLETSVAEIRTDSFQAGRAGQLPFGHHQQTSWSRVCLNLTVEHGTSD
jgi:hypothetical protein